LTENTVPQAEVPPPLVVPNSIPFTSIRLARGWRRLCRCQTSEAPSPRRCFGLDRKHRAVVIGATVKRCSVQSAFMSIQAGEGIQAVRAILLTAKGVNHSLRASLRVLTENNRTAAISCRPQALCRKSVRFTSIRLAQGARHRCRCRTSARPSLCSWQLRLPETAMRMRSPTALAHRLKNRAIHWRSPFSNTGVTGATLPDGETPPIITARSGALPRRTGQDSNTSSAAASGRRQRSVWNFNQLR